MLSELGTYSNMAAIHPSASNPVRRILAGDIGATKTNLSLFSIDPSGLHILHEARFRSRDFASANEMIEQFIAETSQPDKICLAVAGLVADGVVTMTNLDWKLNEEVLAETFNLPVVLLNDLEATAYALPLLGAADFHHVYKGFTRAGNKAVIAPGAGLGEAGLFWDGRKHLPFATEGGHSHFAPTTELDMELMVFLQRRFGYVGWERLLSGPGISAIYDFLVLNKDRDEPAWLKEKILTHDKATMICEYALTSSVCAEAIDHFLRFLATEAASLALKVNAVGGIYIGGGIVPHLIPVLDNKRFHHWFCNAGRLKSHLQNVPITLLINTRLPVFGAAWFGIQEFASMA